MILFKKLFSSIYILLGAGGTCRARANWSFQKNQNSSVNVKKTKHSSKEEKFDQKTCFKLLIFCVYGFTFTHTKEHNARTSQKIVLNSNNTIILKLGSQML